MAATKQAEHKQYLQLLAERNTLRKRIQERAGKEQNELKEREAGFDIYVSGANAERAQRKELARAQPRARAAAAAAAATGGTAGAGAGPTASRTESGAADQLDAADDAAAGSASRPRRGWQQGSVSILADGGAKVRLRPTGGPGGGPAAGGGGGAELSFSSAEVDLLRTSLQGALPRAPPGAAAAAPAGAPAAGGARLQGRPAAAAHAASGAADDEIPEVLDDDAEPASPPPAAPRAPRAGARLGGAAAMGSDLDGEIAEELGSSDNEHTDEESGATSAASQPAPPPPPRPSAVPPLPLGSGGAAGLAPARGGSGGSGGAASARVVRNVSALSARRRPSSGAATRGDAGAAAVGGTASAAALAALAAENDRIRAAAAPGHAAPGRGPSPSASAAPSPGPPRAHGVVPAVAPAGRPPSASSRPSSGARLPPSAVTPRALGGASARPAAPAPTAAGANAQPPSARAPGVTDVWAPAAGSAARASPPPSGLGAPAAPDAGAPPGPAEGGGGAAAARTQPSQPAAASAQPARSEAADDAEAGAPAPAGGVLLERVLRLPPSQQRSLLELLDKIDSAQQTGADLRELWEAVGGGGGAGGGGADGAETEPASAEPPARPAASPSSLLSAAAAEAALVETDQGEAGPALCVRLLANWGHPHHIGLCGLELLDADGAVLLDAPLSAGLLTAELRERSGREISLVYSTELGGGGVAAGGAAGGAGSLGGLGALLDGVTRTAHPLHMLAVALPPRPAVLELLVAPTPAGAAQLGNKRVCGLRIFNYNRPGRDGSKGVRFAELLCGSVVLWAGELRKGAGDGGSDAHATTITWQASMGSEGAAAASGVAAAAAAAAQADAAAGKTAEGGAAGVATAAAPAAAPHAARPRPRPQPSPPLRPAAAGAPAAAVQPSPRRALAAVSQPEPTVAVARGAAAPPPPREMRAPPLPAVKPAAAAEPAPAAPASAAGAAAAADGGADGAGRARWLPGWLQNAARAQPPAAPPGGAPSAIPRAGGLQPSGAAPRSARRLLGGGTVTPVETPRAAALGAGPPLPALSMAATEAAAAAATAAEPAAVDAAAERAPAASQEPLPLVRTLVLALASNWGDRRRIALDGLQLWDGSGDSLGVRAVRALELGPADSDGAADAEGGGALLGPLGEEAAEDKALAARLMRARAGASAAAPLPPVEPSASLDSSVASADLGASGALGGGGGGSGWVSAFEAGSTVHLLLVLEREARLGALRVWNANHSRVHATRGARAVEVLAGGRLAWSGELAKAPGEAAAAARAATTIVFEPSAELHAALARADAEAEAEAAEALAAEKALRSSISLLRAGAGGGRPRTGDAARAAAAAAGAAAQPPPQPPPQGASAAAAAPASSSARETALHEPSAAHDSPPRAAAAGAFVPRLPASPSPPWQPPSAAALASPKRGAVRAADEGGVAPPVDGATAGAEAAARPRAAAAEQPTAAAAAAQSVAAAAAAQSAAEAEADEIGELLADAERALEEEKEAAGVRTDGPAAPRARGHAARSTDAAASPRRAPPDASSPVDASAAGAAASAAERAPATRIGAAGMPEAAVGGWPVARHVSIRILSTWGARDYVGLCALQLLGADGSPIPLRSEQAVVRAPRGALEGDGRTPARLVAGHTLTCAREHAWLHPYDEQQPPTLELTLDAATPIRALRAWNYNTAVDDSWRGCARFELRLDGARARPARGAPACFAKAPGHAEYDHGQTIELAWSHGAADDDEPPLSRPHALLPTAAAAKQDWLTLCGPCARIWRLEILSTWGDPHYVGLDGLELYGMDGARLELPRAKHAAGLRVFGRPDSINGVDGASGDPRVARNVLAAADRPDGTRAEGDSWLAPWDEGSRATLTLVFEQPTALAVLRLRNYSKTARRGAQDVELYADDRIVYRGVLRRAAGGGRARWQSVLFTDAAAHIDTYAPEVYRAHEEGEPMLLVNEGRVMSGEHVVKAEKQRAASARAAARNGGAAAVPRPTTAVTPRG